MRVAMGLEYDGSAYHGWQKQANVNSVQAVVETALSTVADHGVEVVCAGRTDRGVHATSQVIHFDTDAVRAEHQWVFGCNANLPEDVRAHWMRPVAQGFHARFAALARSYTYLICDGRVRSALLRRRVCWSLRPLDVELMASSAAPLLGRHDFSSFRAAGCQARQPVRDVQRLSVTRQGALVVLDIRANAFLHHMVRNIAGVLLAVGRGEQPPHWVQTVLKARDRRRAGVTAPSHGLYLSGVDYPADLAPPDLPQPPPIR